MNAPTLFLTGAAGGFGAATARLFAERGYYVGLYDVNEDALRQLAGELGEARCTYGVLDVTDPRACRAALEIFAGRTGGRLDVVLNNAGITAVGNFEEIPIDRSLAVVDVNLKGCLNVAHAAFPYLRATPGALLINLASASSLHGNPELVAYSLTKRALLSLTESLDIAWAEHDIRSKTLNPIYANTAMVRDTQHLHRNLTDKQVELTAEDVARALYKLKDSGKVHHYLGGQTKLFSRIVGVLPFALRRRLMIDAIGY